MYRLERQGWVKVLNSQLRNYNMVGKLMSIEAMEIDIIMLYKLLAIAYENKGISLTELFKMYREKEGVKVNYSRVKKHIEYAEIKKLVEIEKGKPTRIHVTKKGIDFLFLMNRVLSGVLQEPI